jgi:drug/metabolite transporter (DMT)-like permease
MQGKVLALMTALCFGLNPVILKYGFARKGRSDVAVVIGLLIAVPIYLLWAPFVGGISLAHLSLQAWIGFIFGGIFGGAIGRRWLYLAVQRLGASPAAAIKNSAPMITTALALVVLGEHVTSLQWLAIVEIVVGITLVSWSGGTPGGRWSQFLNVGMLAAIGAAISYGIRPLFLKWGLDQANMPMTAALIGALAAAALAIALTPQRELWTGMWAPSTGAFAISGVLQSLGFLALTFGLSSANVSVVYPVTSAAPLFTLLFTALLLRKTERIRWPTVVGACVIVVGVIQL